MLLQQERAVAWPGPAHGCAGVSLVSSFSGEGSPSLSPQVSGEGGGTLKKEKWI